MTRKDYLKIAEAIAATRRECADMPVSANGAMAFLIGYLESVLKLDNSRFDSARFRKACGLES